MYYRFGSLFISDIILYQIWHKKHLRHEGYGTYYDLGSCVTHKPLTPRVVKLSGPLLTRWQNVGMKKGDLPPITVTKDEDNDDIYNDDVDEKGFCSKGLWVTLQYDRLRNIEGWVSCRPHRNPIFWWSLWWGWASWWILKLARERIYDKNLIYWSESFRV